MSEQQGGALQKCSRGLWLMRDNDNHVYCGYDANEPPKVLAIVEKNGAPFSEWDTNVFMFCMSKKMLVLLSEIASVDMTGVPGGVARLIAKAKDMVGDMDDYVRTRDQDDSWSHETGAPDAERAKPN